MRDGWKYEDCQLGIHGGSTGRCDKIRLKEGSQTYEITTLEKVWPTGKVRLCTDIKTYKKTKLASAYTKHSIQSNAKFAQKNIAAQCKVAWNFIKKKQQKTNSLNTSQFEVVSSISQILIYFKCHI